MRRPVEVRFLEAVRVSPDGTTTSCWTQVGCPNTKLEVLASGVSIELADGSLVTVDNQNIRYVWLSPLRPAEPVKAAPKAKRRRPKREPAK